MIDVGDGTLKALDLFKNNLGKSNYNDVIEDLMKFYVANQPDDNTPEDGG